jgi:hypothetical protein
MLASYGLDVNAGLAGQLLRAHSRLTRPAHAERLKKLLSDCWEAVQGGADGCASAEGPEQGEEEEEAGRWLSKEQCRAFMVRHAGADDVDEVLEDVVEEEKVDFAHLVSLVVQARLHALT